MNHIKRVFAPAICLAAGSDIALAQCSIRDVSHELTFDCYNTTWQGVVFYSWYGFSGYYGVGGFTGVNVRDPGGLECSGTTRQPRTYKATKSLNSYTDQYLDQQVTFWWNTNDQYLSWESRQFNGQSASRATNCSFTDSSGWYTLWCD